MVYYSSMVKENDMNKREAIAAVARHFGIDKRNPWESRRITGASLVTNGKEYEVYIDGIRASDCRNVYVVRATGAVEEEV